MVRWLLTLLLTAALGACQEAGDGTPVDGAPVDGARLPDGPLPRIFGEAAGRPVTLRVPQAYDPSQPIPLVLLLHGYGANGYLEATLLGYTEQFEKAPFLLVYPNGTEDPIGKLFWNATDACCDYYDAKVDDSSYLSTLISEIEAVYNVDPRRIYLIGHSNGGFMAYRMACDHAQRIAAVVSLAGATYLDTSACTPAARVSVLQVHGDQDDMVRYDGGKTQGGQYPGARATTAAWAGYNGCGAALQSMATKLDLDSLVPGAETEVARYTGCPAGVDVELWTLRGSGHVPVPTPDFALKTWEFFRLHPRP